jgi:hypothetical protein
LADGLKFIVIPILAVAALLVSVILMPWSELNFTGDFPTWLAWAMGPLGVAAFFHSIPWGDQLKDFLLAQGAKTHFGDYAYALFMGLAMVAAAIAIVIVGREEAEEKTVLPVKK